MKTFFILNVYMILMKIKFIKKYVTKLYDNWLSPRNRKFGQTIPN